MNWKLPPKIKVYEALGAVADGRVKLETSLSAAVTSSSGGKAYRVMFDPQTNCLDVNDNGSYWQGYVGYPGIAYLMVTGRITFDTVVGQKLKGIKWKEVNQKFKNDFAKTEAYLGELVPKEELETAAEKVLVELEQLNLTRPTVRSKPPKGW